MRHEGRLNRDRGHLLLGSAFDVTITARANACPPFDGQVGIAVSFGDLSLKVTRLTPHDPEVHLDNAGILDGLAVWISDMVVRDLDLKGTLQQALQPTLDGINVGLVCHRARLSAHALSPTFPESGAAKSGSS